MPLLTSTNPGRNYEVVGTIAASSPEEVKAAVVKAKTAQPAWARLPVEGRIGFYEKLLAHTKEQAAASGERKRSY